MKKTGIFALLIMISLQACGFAMTAEPAADPMGADHENIFTMEELIETGVEVNKENVKSLTYSAMEDAYYVILTKDYSTHNWDHVPVQWVYSSNGDKINQPQYPEIMGYDRGQIVFDGNEVYSIEKLHRTRGHLFRLSGETPQAMSGRIYDSRCSGLLAQNGSLADYIFYMNYQYHAGTPIFSAQIGIPIESRLENSMHVWDKRFDYSQVSGYDFTSDGKQIVYGGRLKSDNEWGEEIRIVRFEGTEVMDYFVEKGQGLVNEFSLKLPAKPEEMDVVKANMQLKGLYTTDEAIVVLVEVGALKESYLQRYTLNGEFIDQTPVDHSAAAITEGPNGETVYLRQSLVEERLLWEAVKCVWQTDEEEKVQNRPASSSRPLIAEHRKGGKTMASYAANEFGLVKRQDSATGAQQYLVPIRTKDAKVNLCIPYGDVARRIENQLDQMVISYGGKEIQIAMSKFECADVFAKMSCQTDAYFEIQLQQNEEEITLVSIQVLTIEQVNEKTKLVHRQSIY
ncbi:hypothetical protein SANA_29300 [Gottschalkiaceae bacterium SANA]|nr:hypothetical protein SANA_29300 [Gottschalkiaceae bacterium SANA]